MINHFKGSDQKWLNIKTKSKKEFYLYNFLSKCKSNLPSLFLKKAMKLVHLKKKDLTFKALISMNVHILLRKLMTRAGKRNNVASSNLTSSKLNQSIKSSTGIRNQTPRKSIIISEKYKCYKRKLMNLKKKYTV